MIVYTTNILVLPLVLLIWSVDVYLLIVSLRLILGQLSATRNSRLRQAFQEIVDPIPNRVSAWLQERRDRPSPGWAPWIIVIGVGLVVRHLLVLILVLLSQAEV